MGKVYRIYEHICEDSYSPSEVYTLGIFTDKEVADDILSKLKSRKENRIKELFTSTGNIEDELSKLSFEERHNHYRGDFGDMCHELSQLEITSYFMEELIINQLYTEL
jgi:hypothetical protein